MKRFMAATVSLAAFLVLILVVPGLASSGPDSQPAPAAYRWMNRSLSPLNRAQLLVKAMTLDEKVEQIHMADVKTSPREIPGIPRLGIPTFKVTNGPVGAGPGETPAFSGRYYPVLATTTRH